MQYRADSQIPGIETIREAASIYGVPLQAEKELIAIVASAERRNVIMETIQLKHGRESGAGAVICSIGLEQTASWDSCMHNEGIKYKKW